VIGNFSEESDYATLYDVLISELGLSPDTLGLLEDTGVTSVGDCIDYHIHKHYAMINASLAYREAMEGEVKERLKEHGYWSFYEEVIRADSNPPQK
jgi:hypothetical protein